jgi:hypothetical protein
MFSGQSGGANCFVGMISEIKYSPPFVVGEGYTGKFLPTLILFTK